MMKEVEQKGAKTKRERKVEKDIVRKMSRAAPPLPGPLLHSTN
jgi:hypothetical protein